MVQVGRLVPVERDRRHHSVRAVITAHKNHVTGWWFWKQTHPSIEATIDGEEYQKLCQTLEQIRDPNGMPLQPISKVEIGFTSQAKRNEYQLGEKVTLLYSTSNAIANFFTGAQLHRWDGIEKIEQN